MIQGHWWERVPERLEYELQALKQAAIPWEQDPDALKGGVCRLRLRAAVDGREQLFLITFPDLYPYFRFEVEAPDTQLPYHQHPLSKFLCLMGRSTHFWNTSDTVAALVSEQVPRVFATAKSVDRAAVATEEQQQAEPYGDYYPYAPSMLLVEGGWGIPAGERSGPLVIGTVGQLEEKGDEFIHGCVLEIQNNKHTVLARADQPLRDLYSGRRLSGRWVRADQPIACFEAREFFDHVRVLDPGRANNQGNVVNGGRLYIWGVLFPEEVSWRQHGEGWVFVCLFEEERRVSKRSKFVSQKLSKEQKTKVSKSWKAYFARAGRAGTSDLRVRAPELQPLGTKTVAVFGLGCLGAPSSLELARAGLGHLKVIDDDIVDPGTITRWPLGLSAAGRKKVEVIREFIEHNYPHTKVTPFDHRIGGVRLGNAGEIPDEAVLEKIVSGASLIYDATAESGVQHFLADLALHRKIPYISVVGTLGGWGGKIIRLVPGQTEGCWLCCQVVAS